MQLKIGVTNSCRDLLDLCKNKFINNIKLYIKQNLKSSYVNF